MLPNSNHENPFQVPTHYFEELELKIMDRKRPRTRTIIPLRWAAAASIVGALSLGAWYFRTTNAPCVQLSCIDEEELYQAAYQYDLEILIENQKNQIPPH